MLDFFALLFDVSDFPPRWHCGRWSDGLGWLHILSDLAVFASYVAIPFVIIFYMRRRPGLPFNRLFFLFAAFIFACGTVHLIEATIFWWPIYRVSGIVKLITAVVSVATVLALIPAAPAALAMRSPKELEAEIEERKKVEAELRVSEERLQRALRVTDEAVWDWDKHSDTIWCSPRHVELFGKRPLHANPWNWLQDLIHPEDRESAELSFQQLLSSTSNVEPRWSSTYRCQVADGSYRSFENQALVSRDNNGAPTRIIGTLKDVTELKHQEEERLRSERLSAIGQAMAGLVHESRNALARSQAGLNLLARRIEDQPDLQRYIDETLSAQTDLGRLFEEVRQYAAPKNLDSRFLNLYSHIAKIWEQTLDATENEDAELELNSNGLAPNLKLDAFSIGGVFRNLFENSIAACMTPARIRIDFFETDFEGMNAIQIRYTDNGPGLTDEMKTRVFEAFYTTKTRGTGLGMAIAKRSVENHNGKIEVGSSTHAGAEFIITLPIVL